MSSTQGYRGQAPSSLNTGSPLGTDEDYDYTSSYRTATTSSRDAEEKAYMQAYTKQGLASPPPPPPPGRPKSKSRTPPQPESARPSPKNDDPLQDLEQLEEVHEEAERMKALGNKHMAAQEYTRAFNAYSAALQLSPVGPSSHVFLCNRAAALLSLKRYAAAATDARRAVALAPTFGKAHARLGQSLYFLKDYEGAVAAYEEAVKFEADNAVTQAYLDKAKSKLARQQDRARRQARGEEVSVAEDSTAYTISNSIATDPNLSAAVIRSEFRGNNKALMAAAGRSSLPREVGSADNVEVLSPLAADGGEYMEDPDFDEAVRIQEYANKCLAEKRYKDAIDEYSAALFLVPDDPYLSPELHLGRAHALNGSRRHESARNDALLAIKINPTAEAYSTLAKSLFYMNDYLGAVAAFEDCMDLLPQGESLSMFDQAYLRKAEAAWQDELENNPAEAQSIASSSRSPSIPKLPPPRFVPREKAINDSPVMPPMPKKWPQQSIKASTLKVGPERTVTFLSESLGIKLNRGSDGVVRVISVSPETPGSPIARSGTIEPGDVIREAAGVDVRRPITNIMWGDTIALVKIAPRPITFVVAKELSEVPAFVLEERERMDTEASMSPASKSSSRGESKEEEVYIMPSCANGEESVRDSIAMANERASLANTAASGADEQVSATVDSSSSPSSESVPSSSNENVDSLDSGSIKDGDGDVADGAPETGVPSEPAALPKGDEREALTTGGSREDGIPEASKEDGPVSEQTEEMEYLGVDDQYSEEKAKESTSHLVTADRHPEESLPPACEGKGSSSQQAEAESEAKVEGATEPIVSHDQQRASSDKEADVIGGEILFERTENDASFGGWSNLRWMSTAGERRLRFCELVNRTIVQKGLFRSNDQQVRRKLAIFEKPSLILVLRPPKNASEVRKLLDLPGDVALEDERNALHSFLVAESVIDPITCKLRLSPLTTVTSVGSFSEENETSRRRTCLELVTPTETVVLSALAATNDQALVGSPAFLETAGLEVAISNALYDAHRNHADPNGKADVTWKHQIVQGTLHFYVLSGNNVMLEKAIKAAISQDASQSQAPTKYVRPQIIDAQDESGRTALHYACLRQASQAVSLLTKAGASCAIPVNPGGFFPSHLSALVHDEKSLSVILSSSYPARPDPNPLDVLVRTPMYLAAVDGKSMGGESDVDSLGRCLSALSAWGGKMLVDDGPTTLRNPVNALASRWLPGELASVLMYMPFRYPLQSAMSVGASFQYPIHTALVTLRNRIQMVSEGEPDHELQIDDRSPECVLVGTLRVLLEHGIEANERLECVTDDFDGASELSEYMGWAPLQILALAAIDADSLQDSAGAALKHSIAQMIAGAAELLVRCGARLALEPPPSSRLSRSSSTVSNDSVTSASGDEVESSRAYRAAIQKDNNKTLFKLIGGEERLKEARDLWLQAKSVSVTDKVILQKEAAKSNLSDSEEPGGSDEKSCAICWKAFGTLMNRKHKCRVSLRYVCEECSSKRVSDGKDEYRVSDGQFCLARVDAAREAAAAIAAENEKSRMKLEKVRASRQAPSVPSDEENRDSLFEDVMNKAANLVFGEDEDENTTDRLDGLASQMNQTKDALNERGAKLSSLGEKTSRLVDSSAEFAKMAKELERSQRGFW